MSFAALQTAATGRPMMYDAYQGMADVGDRVRSARRQCSGRPRSVVVAALRLAVAEDGRLLRTGGARRLHPCAARLGGRRHRGRRTRIRGRPGRRHGDAVLRAAPFPQSGRRRRSEGAARRADVGPFRHAVARHAAHAAQRSSGLRHRLGQPAQRQAGGGRLRARRLHPAPDRFRPPHRRGLPHRRRLPADGQRADRHRRARRRGRQCAAGEPDADGGADRHARRADQGQRTGAGKADRMVPRQPHRHRAGAIRGRRAAGLSRLPPALRVHEHERRAPRQVASSTCSSAASPAISRRRTRSAPSIANISPSWT